MTPYGGLADITFESQAAGTGRTQMLEVIHPEIEKGGFELDLPSGVRLDAIDPGKDGGDPALSHGAQISWAVAGTRGAEYALGPKARVEVEQVFDGGKV